MLCLALALATTAGASAAGNTAGKTTGKTKATDGSVVQSVGAPVPQNPSPPQLHLSGAQRAQVRDAVMQRDTAADPQSKAVKPAAGFTPAIGATLPKPLAGNPLPRPLVYKIPALKQYEYVRFRDDVLIVDPMKHTIVDVISTSG
jgi:hypothetical protein